MLDEARKYDLEELSKSKEKANPEDRAKIDKAGKAIVNQSRLVSSYREALIREIRAGRIENVKDINHELSKLQ